MAKYSEQDRRTVIGWFPGLQNDASFEITSDSTPAYNCIALAPSKTTGKCQLENFRGESTLTSWLKTTCLCYCYNKYELKERIYSIDQFEDDWEDSEKYIIILKR